jgi:hypothetical protein
MEGVGLADSADDIDSMPPLILGSVAQLLGGWPPYRLSLSINARTRWSSSRAPVSFSRPAGASRDSGARSAVCWVLSAPGSLLPQEQNQRKPPHIARISDSLSHSSRPLPVSGTGGGLHSLQRCGACSRASVRGIVISSSRIASGLLMVRSTRSGRTAALRRQVR